MLIARSATIGRTKRKVSAGTRGKSGTFVRRLFGRLACRFPHSEPQLVVDACHSDSPLE